MMVEESKASQMREFRLSRGRDLKPGRSNLSESIALVNGGGGVVAHSTGDDGNVRLKIVVRKQDLKQILEAMKNSVSSPMPSLSLEQRLFLMRRRLSAGKFNHGKVNRRISWRPALQSIPEER
ncbi:hypothetical protein Nepgr_004776 [Nepenthes gracilis]|uniref:Uncharacterized protein n=1 Tax=Nepenthes gracilis TaxID=150966 RepID=A0AAD3XFR7_NEPGR|nr:hypothetical protein Nepgr_004776 [Nepenthes gracilis]